MTVAVIILIITVGGYPDKGPRSTSPLLEMPSSADSVQDGTQGPTFVPDEPMASPIERKKLIVPHYPLVEKAELQQYGVEDVDPLAYINSPSRYPALSKSLGVGLFVGLTSKLYMTRKKVYPPLISSARAFSVALMSTAFT